MSPNLRPSSRISAIFLVAIALMLLLRASCLETLEILDPTEARYATIAAEMWSRGEYLSPMIPMPTGMEPYLGKPPLHFWVTAGSFGLFGIDEWSARMPSFLALCVTTVLLLVFATQFFSLHVGLLGAAIMLSSAVFFFFGGASVVDITLTAALTLTLTAFAISTTASGRSRQGWGALAGIGLGLGFLTKGPVIIALLVSTAAILFLLRRDRSSFARIPLRLALLVASVMVVPWFVAAEIEHPGFVRYFFWNENIARYLFKDYGDRYGSGHRYRYGAAWLMLIAAFLPWAPVCAVEIWKRRREKLSEPMAILLAWGLSSAVFFTLVRQLHIGYLLPGIPPLALYLAGALLEARPGAARVKDSDIVCGRRWRRLIALCAGAAVMGSMVIVGIGVPLLASNLVPLGASCVVALLLLVRTGDGGSPDQASGAGRMIAFATALVALYVVALVGVAPVLNRSSSSMELLATMTSRIPARVPIIGVITRNTFSHYWAALAWETELPKRVRIEFITEQNSNSLTDLLVKRKDFYRLPDGISHRFKEIMSRGEWVWLRARDLPPLPSRD